MHLHLPHDYVKYDLPCGEGFALLSFVKQNHPISPMVTVGHNYIRQHVEFYE